MKKTANRYFPIAQWTQEFERKGDSPRLKVAAWIKADHVTKAILDALVSRRQRGVDARLELSTSAPRSRMIARGPTTGSVTEEAL